MNFTRFFLSLRLMNLARRGLGLKSKICVSIHPDAPTVHSLRELVKIMETHFESRVVLWWGIKPHDTTRHTYEFTVSTNGDFETAYIKLITEV